VKFEGDGLLKRYAVDEHARVNSYPWGVLTNLPSDHKSDILARNEALPSKVRCFNDLLLPQCSLDRKNNCPYQKFRTC
jgi:hypothetical protein